MLTVESHPTSYIDTRSVVVEDEGNHRQHLLADPEFSDHRPVAVDVFAFEIVEKTSSTSHQLQQTTPRVKVFAVGTEVLGEVLDALAEQRDLNLGGAGVCVTPFELTDDVGFAIGRESHSCFCGEPHGSQRMSTFVRTPRIDGEARVVKMERLVSDRERSPASRPSNHRRVENDLTLCA